MVRDRRKPKVDGAPNEPLNDLDNCRCGGERAWVRRYSGLNPVRPPLPYKSAMNRGNWRLVRQRLFGPALAGQILRITTRQRIS